jgi:hypothetical protein
MSRSRPDPPPSGRPAVPQAALDALLEGDAGQPLRRALWLDMLDQKLRPYLPPPLAAHARLANLDRGRLVFLVDSPVWHARLRLLADPLLDAARSLGLEATELVVKTTTATLPDQRRSAVAKAAETPSTPLSATAQATLREALALLEDRSSEATSPGDSSEADIS